VIQLSWAARKLQANARACHSESGVIQSITRGGNW